MVPPILEGNPFSMVIITLGGDMPVLDRLRDA